MLNLLTRIAQQFTFHAIQRNYNGLMVFIFLMLTSNSANATTPVDWFNNITKTFSPAMLTMTGAAYLGGAYFIYDGIMKMKEKPQNPQIKASAIFIDWAAGLFLIGFGIFGGGLREQVLGGGGSSSTAGFSSF